MSHPAPSPYTGGCLCGAVRYEAAGAPVVVAQCHCAECRKTSGAGHAIGAMFRAEDVALTGTVGEFRYASAAGNQVTKSFCPNCGCPILGRNTGMPGHVTIALGTMDDAADLRTQVVVFSRDRQPWDVLDPDTPCFEAQPDWTPERGL